MWFLKASFMKITRSSMNTQTCLISWNNILIYPVIHQEQYKLPQVNPGIGIYPMVIKLCIIHGCIYDLRVMLNQNWLSAHHAYGWRQSRAPLNNLIVIFITLQNAIFQSIFYRYCMSMNGNTWFQSVYHTHIAMHTRSGQIWRKIDEV